MLEKEWLLTCAPIGKLESTKNSWKAVATGVFVYDNPFIWYVTSYEPVCNSGDTSLHVLLKHKKNNHILFDISSMHKQESIDWISDEQNNIAATLFPANPDFELKAIGQEHFMALKDMLPAMSCYSVGYPYVMAEQDAKNLSPFVLEGVISKIDDENWKVYVTTPLFSENFGCPLFIWKSPFNSNHSIVLGNPAIYFGGIMTTTITVETSDGKDTNPHFRSIYLNGVSSPELIKNLLCSPRAISQKKKLKEKNGN